MNSSGLLLGVKGLDASQAKSLLKGSRKPLLSPKEELPAKEVLDLIKEKDCALGLTLGSGEDAASHFKKLDEAKQALSKGTDIPETLFPCPGQAR